MFALTLSEVESALAELHDVRDDRRPAFQARLKHLQKLGFPSGTNTGKGRRAEYDLEAIGRLVGAFELMQFGMIPTIAIEVIEQGWPLLKISLASALHELLTGEVLNQFGMYWVWIFNPQVLSDLTGDAKQIYAGAGACRVKDAEKEIWQEWKDDNAGWMPEVGRGYRHMLINISWALGEFFGSLPHDIQVRFAQAVDDLNDWRFAREEYTLLEADIGRWGIPFFEGKVLDASDS